MDCDRTGLAPGEYKGTVTFKSKFDRYENTRIEVRFLVLESPLERNMFPPTSSNTVIPFGITLDVLPFNGTRPELTSTLIMGSSPLARTGVDSLTGEYARIQPLLSGRLGQSYDFEARFFLDPNIYSRNYLEAEYPELSTAEVTAMYNSLVNNGFGDYTHHDGVNQTGTTVHKNPRSNSRDIRSSIQQGQSNTHYIKFEHRDPAVDYFPVVLR